MASTGKITDHKTAIQHNDFFEERRSLKKKVLLLHPKPSYAAKQEESEENVHCLRKGMKQVCTTSVNIGNKVCTYFR